MKMQVPAAVAASFFSAFAFAQGAPDPRPGASTPVQVTNSTTNPVPVNVLGGAVVSGSVTANQGGTWNVTVGNTSTAPLYVVDVTKRDIFIVHQFTTVPDGKIYVIEHWHVKCDIPNTGVMQAARLHSTVGTDELEDLAVPQFLQPSGGANNRWAASGTTTIRLPAGATFSVEIHTTNLAAAQNCVRSVSGYVMDSD